MDWTIPQEMIDSAAEAFDSLLTSAGKDCILLFPRTRTECPNCFVNVADGTSTGIYKSGGSQPFENHTICPVCSGEGHIGVEVTETVRMRIYDNPATWMGQVPADLPAGSIQTRSPLDKYAAVVTSRHMRIDAEGYRNREYELAGDPVDPYGLVAGRWVVAFWKRVQ